MAQPSDNPMYDQEFYRLCVLDYDVMKRIASKVTPPRKVSVDEVRIAGINRGKSEDIYSAYQLKVSTMQEKIW